MCLSGSLYLEGSLRDRRLYDLIDMVSVDILCSGYYV